MPTCNVLIGATGSVASIKIPILVKEIKTKMQSIHCKVFIKIVATKHSLHFFNATMIPSDVTLLVDKDEWKDWNTIGDPVQHIELRRWADVFIVAPLDANTMAKMAVGMCDNLLTSVARAWDRSKPLYFAPAMNTLMWNHPLTAGHVKVLTHTLGYQMIPPVTKNLACGDTGMGAMASPETIAESIMEFFPHHARPGSTLTALSIAALISLVIFNLCHKS